MVMHTADPFVLARLTLFSGRYCARRVDMFSRQLIAWFTPPGVETYIESVLVGADDLRVKFEELLATKQQLVGV